VIHVIGPNPIEFARRAHFTGHPRAVDNSFPDTYRLETQNTVLDATIEQIDRVDGEFVATLRYSRRDETVQLTYDRVITCTGFRMDTEIFDETCRPKPTVNGRFPALTSEWESVNVPDLYFAGALTQVRDNKKDTSAFIHDFRYGSRALQRMLDRKYEDIEWPHRVIPADPAVMTSTVLARINRSSALFQQYAFLCDLIVLEPDGLTARYYEELPVDYVQDSVFGADSRYFMVTLEYGDGHDAIDPFDVEAGRAWEADPDHDDRYLHPVARHYSLWKPISVRHLPEDMGNDWTGEADYRLPLCDFFTRQMALAPA
jgi:hypothetical protein